MWNSLYFNFLAGWKDLGLASSEEEQLGIQGQGVIGNVSKALYLPPPMTAAITGANHSWC